MHLGPKNENLSMSENDKICSKQNQKNLNKITYWAQNDKNLKKSTTIITINFQKV